MPKQAHHHSPRQHSSSSQNNWPLNTTGGCGSSVSGGNPPYPFRKAELHQSSQISNSWSPTDPQSESLRSPHNKRSPHAISLTGILVNRRFSYSWDVMSHSGSVHHRFRTHHIRLDNFWHTYPGPVTSPTIITGTSTSLDRSETFNSNPSGASMLYRSTYSAYTMSQGSSQSD